jgi:S1-C subfamily serine protease
MLKSSKNLYMALIMCVALGATAAIATNFADAGSTSTNAPSAAGPTASAIALQDAFIAVYQRVSPSVVQIQTPSGLGSGVVYDTKGHIVTNDHVVAGARTFVVTTAAGKWAHATLVGEFAADDLAVIKVTTPSALRAATFADSTKLRVGQIAVAIGNPLGLASSVTDGIVSAINRQVPEGNGITLRNAIQTSAPINPGNSGGALADIQGRVIGIPTLAAASSQSGGSAAGIGFAIPSSVVKDIAAQLIRYGRVVNSHRAYLGVQVADTGRGVYVASVASDGPAGRAGIVVGDLITSVAGKATLTSDDLGAVLAGLRPNQPTKLQITRQNGATTAVTVTLGELPGS